MPTMRIKDIKIEGQSGTGKHDVFEGKTNSFGKELSLENTSCLVLHGFVVTTVLNGVVYLLNLQMSSKKQTADGLAKTSKIMLLLIVLFLKRSPMLNCKFLMKKMPTVGTKVLRVMGLGNEQPSSWMLITSNLFLHLSRKDQIVDEVMVCHCKPPVNCGLGYGSQC